MMHDCSVLAPLPDGLHYPSHMRAERVLRLRCIFHVYTYMYGVAQRSMLAYRNAQLQIDTTVIRHGTSI